jgi:hypothetical protein
VPPVRAPNLDEGLRRIDVASYPHQHVTISAFVDAPRGRPTAGATRFKRTRLLGRSVPPPAVYLFSSPDLSFLRPSARYTIGLERSGGWRPYNRTCIVPADAAIVSNPPCTRRGPFMRVSDNGTEPDI